MGAAFGIATSSLAVQAMEIISSPVATASSLTARRTFGEAYSETLTSVVKPMRAPRACVGAADGAVVGGVGAEVGEAESS